MEFYAYPLRQLVAISSSILSDLVEWVSQNRDFTAFLILRRISSVAFTCCFALVGTVLGFMTGAFLGQETESGLVRGAAIGAISGAVFALEVFESFVALWRSEQSTIGCLLYLIDVIGSLLSGRLVRERMGPAILSAVQSQMAEDDSSYDELTSIFDIGTGAKAVSSDSLDKIPTIKITKDDTVDSSGDKVCCSVCLQDFQIGEAVRHLPHCRHMFHLACIDKWLLKHGSCPLCRRDL